MLPIKVMPGMKITKSRIARTLMPRHRSAS
jgi:hypothetical protein